MRTTENPRLPHDLRGRTAVITGAGRNIGKGIATTLAHCGASVVVVDVDADAAAGAAEDIRRSGGEATSFAGDMTHRGDVLELFAFAQQQCGLPDILVNNAYARIGESNWGSFLEIAPDDWDEFLNANLAMLFLPTQRFARGLVHARSTGAIVNIGSNGSDRVHRNQIAYDSMKGALDSFTKAIAVDLAAWGIRVNAVRPGAMDLRGLSRDGRDNSAYEQIPLGRGADPKDIGYAVAYLASTAADYVTGQLLTVDGGLLVQGRAPAAEGVTFATPETLAVTHPHMWPSTKSG